MKAKLIDTPIGRLRLLAADEQLIAVEFEGMYRPATIDETTPGPLLEGAARQLGEYFAGKRMRFDLPLAPAGTAFQREVWAALAEIPFGELRSYREIARDINRPRAVRAVGAANGRNPLPIVVPCHRVIGSDGSLTGFAGGLSAKQALLKLEGSWPG